MTFEEDDPDRVLKLAAFDIDVEGAGFGSLAFSLEKNGEALGAARLFDTPEAVLAYFEDRMIRLATGLEAGDSILARFELELGPTSSFSMGLGFARIVPEPGSAALLALGLVCLARRQRA